MDAGRPRGGFGAFRRERFYKIDVTPRHGFNSVSLTDGSPCCGGHSLQHWPVLGQSGNDFGELPWVPRNAKAVLAIDHFLNQARDVMANRHKPQRHCFQQRQRPTFMIGSHNKNVVLPDEWVEFRARDIRRKHRHAGGNMVRQSSAEKGLLRAIAVNGELEWNPEFLQFVDDFRKKA